MEVPTDCNLPQLKKIVHHELLNARRLENVVMSSTFESVYEYSNADFKDKAQKLITQMDADGLIKLIKQQVERDIGDFNVRVLRHIASRLGVFRYSFLTKAELLSEIVTREKERLIKEVS